MAAGLYRLWKRAVCRSHRYTWAGGALRALISTLLLVGLFVLCLVFCALLIIIFTQRWRYTVIFRTSFTVKVKLCCHFRKNRSCTFRRLVSAASRFLSPAEQGLTIRRHRDRAMAPTLMSFFICGGTYGVVFNFALGPMRLTSEKKERKNLNLLLWSMW